MLSGLAGSVVGGIGSGIGFSVANRAVDAVMGPRKMEVIHTNEAVPAAPAAPAAGRCQNQLEDYTQCVSRHQDAGLCGNYLDTLKQCQAGA